MKIKELLKGDKKTGLGIYILLLAGIALLAFGSMPEKESQAEIEAVQVHEDYISELEERLAQMLSKIEGAGEVEVMLVAENSGSIDVGRDGNGESGKTVVLTKSGGSEALVLAENTPEVRGALIIAEGGGSAGLRASLTEAVSTALGLGAHRVRVYKMKK